MKPIVLNQNQKSLRKRIIEISFRNRLSHIGSCLNAVDLIDAIYSHKKENDIFILSAGHAAVAWYAVLEKHHPGLNFDQISCIHPDKLTNEAVTVSTGSLGHGLPIAVGMALADKSVAIYCLLSDGECAEGSIWESLRIVSQQALLNLIVLVTANGYGAYDSINTATLKKQLRGFGFSIINTNGHNPQEIRQSLEAEITTKPKIIFANTRSDQLSFLQGINAHYYVMGQDYFEAVNSFS